MMAKNSAGRCCRVSRDILVCVQKTSRTPDPVPQLNANAGSLRLRTFPEFEMRPDDTRPRLIEFWERGWSMLFASLGALTEADLSRTIKVQKLSPTELNAFLRWLDEFSAAQWDTQIENDVSTGRLDHLLSRVDADFDAGRCKEL